MAWSSTKMTYAKDTRETPRPGLGAATTPGVGALEVQPTTIEEPRVRCTVVKRGTAAATTVENGIGIGIAIEDGRTRDTEARQVDKVIPNAIYPCIMHLRR